MVLLAHSTDRVVHAHGTLRWWRSDQVVKALRRYLINAGQRHPEASNPEADDTSVDEEIIERWWVDWPTRLRLEVEHPHLPRLRIIDGDEWWSLDADGRVRGSAGYAMAYVYRGAVPEMLDPSALLPGPTITAAELSEWGGVEVLAADARPRRTMRQLALVRPEVLVRHADRYRFLIHAELGVLIRAESYVDDQLAQVTELVDFVFGDPADDELFRFAMPPGATLEPAPDATGRLRDGTKVRKSVPTEGKAGDIGKSAS